MATEHSNKQKRDINDINNKKISTNQNNILAAAESKHKVQTKALTKLTQNLTTNNYQKKKILTDEIDNKSKTQTKEELQIPDLSGQRITDVPQLNKDRCSPLIQTATAANFFMGTNLLVNGYFPRISTTIAQTPLAFTDGTNFNALLDPAMLLCGVVTTPDTICFGDNLSNFGTNEPLNDLTKEKKKEATKKITIPEEFVLNNKKKHSSNVIVVSSGSNKPLSNIENGIKKKSITELASIKEIFYSENQAKCDDNK